MTSVKTRLASAAAVVFASALMLAMQGYQFGKSNHTVYLLDALRHASPNLLANDWFATETLQYHAIFGVMTRWLFALRIIQPAFLIGYLALLVLLHLAWWRITIALGGALREFVVSAVLFQLLAGGTGLGMYSFLQDGAFLPSNIAAVAMVWGIAFGMEKRPIASGVCMGVAGLFHLNYALVSPIVWLAIHWRARAWFGAVAAIVPAVINIGFALQATASRSAAMPLAEFVALYVKLRHPHHYDPASWPWWLWVTFLLPLPFALRLSFREKKGDVPLFSRFGRTIAVLALLIGAALLGAGIFFVSETLVQASLYRFSVFLKLLTCVAAAILIGRTRAASWSAFALGCVLIAACIWRGPYGGLFHIPEDDKDYLAACDWIRDHTEANDIFIVPPSEQEFRLRARRGIVVNFKGCPQLSAELKEWRDRLSDVLDMPDLTALPHPFPATLAAIEKRYAELPPARLIAAAKKYGARYVLTPTRWPEQFEPARVDLAANRWFLYDCVRLP